MKIHTLEKIQFVALPRERVFSFFRDPLNLARITPPSLGFHILTPPPVPMHAGSIIDYTIRLAGFPVRWTTAIAEYDPPRRFVDVQLRGPYSFWHHTHEFEDAGEGTQMTDRVAYALPFGFIGGWIHTLAVKKQLAAIFEFRTAAVKKLLLEAGGGEDQNERKGT